MRLFQNLSKIIHIKAILSRSAANSYYQMLLHEPKQQKIKKQTQKQKQSLIFFLKQLRMIAYEFRSRYDLGFRANSI